MDQMPPNPEEAIEHMWNAAHEFLRAMRTLVDAADQFVEQQRAPRGSGEAREPRLHRIDLDLADDDTERGFEHDVDSSWP